MKIISDNSDEDIRRKDAEREVGFAVRDLAANMVRIMTGGGETFAFFKQIGQVVESVKAWNPTVGQLGALLTRELDIDSRPRPANNDEPYVVTYDRLDDLLRLALQAAAPRVARSQPQVNVRERKLSEHLEHRDQRVIDRHEEFKKRERSPKYAAKADAERERIDRMIDEAFAATDKAKEDIRRLMRRPEGLTADEAVTELAGNYPRLNIRSCVRDIARSSRPRKTVSKADRGYIRYFLDEEA
jgi:hypothetical protein